MAVLAGLWPTNMGNSFLQLGAQALMRSAFPASSVYLASAMPRWLMTYGYEVPDPFGTRGRARDPRWKQLGRRLLGRALRRYDDSALLSFTPPDPAQALDLLSVGGYDLIVMPGMLLCEFMIKTIGDSLRTATRSGTRLLFLGAGLEKYTVEEAGLVRDFMREIQPIGFVSRDRRSFDLVSEAVLGAHAGIDCGFFVADAFRPPPVRLPDYVVAAFDKSAGAPAGDRRPPARSGPPPLLWAHTARALGGRADVDLGHP